MKCKTLHKNLIFFLEGDLPAKEMELIRTHLSECSDCSLFAEELKKTLGVLEIEKSPEVNPFFYTRLKARLESVENKETIFWKPFFIKVLQPAFFSILLLAGIYSGVKIGQPSSLRLSIITHLEQEIPILNEMETESIESFLME